MFHLPCWQAGAAEKNGHGGWGPEELHQLRGTNGPDLEGQDSGLKNGPPPKDQASVRRGRPNPVGAAPPGWVFWEWDRPGLLPVRGRRAPGPTAVFRDPIDPDRDPRDDRRVHPVRNRLLRGDPSEAVADRDATGDHVDPAGFWQLGFWMGPGGSNVFGRSTPKGGGFVCSTLEGEEEHHGGAGTAGFLHGGFPRADGLLAILKMNKGEII